jgi:hypothetical protein
MPHYQIMEKYGLSSDAFQRVLDEFGRVRKARAQALAQDVKAGCSDAQLMQKYQLSRDGLQSAFATLVDEGLIGLKELGSRHSLQQESIVVNFRKNVRRKPVEKVTVCEPSHPERQYVLRDISMDGLSLFGMSAEVNQICTLAVLGDDDGEVMPFEFDAECRWATHSLSGDPEIAGFQIVSISEENREPLEALVQRYATPFGFGES